MAIRLALIFAVMAIIAAVIYTGTLEDDRLPAPGSTSVDGAVIETGMALDEFNQILAAADTFKANQDFYIHFDNNGPFNHEQVVFKLIDTKNDKILAQENLTVKPEEEDIHSLVFFNNPGLYRIVAFVGGEVRATREVVIEK